MVAGASAARDNFQAEFQLLCQAATTNLYRALPTANQDFRAYSCTLLNAAPVPVALRNTNVTVYYRSEGGSGWGPGSVAKNIPIKRLVVDGACTLVAPPGLGDCAVAGYIARHRRRHGPHRERSDRPRRVRPRTRHASW